MRRTPFRTFKSKKMFALKTIEYFQKHPPSAFWSSPTLQATFSGKPTQAPAPPTPRLPTVHPYKLPVLPCVHLNMTTMRQVFVKLFKVYLLYLGLNLEFLWAILGCYTPGQYNHVIIHKIVMCVFFFKYSKSDLKKELRENGFMLFTCPEPSFLWGKPPLFPSLTAQGRQSGPVSSGLSDCSGPVN